MKQVKHDIDPESTKAVTSLRDSKPKNVGENRKLTGLLNYYRRFFLIDFIANKKKHSTIQWSESSSSSFTKRPNQLG